MEPAIRFDCSGVDWKMVSETLQRAGMASYEPEVHKKAFEASHTAVFIYSHGRLIGFGRALSDGMYQAAVYDVAVLPECQRQGIGKMIMQAILARIPQCNVILYASPGKGFHGVMSISIILRDSSKKFTFLTNSEVSSTL